MHIARIEMRYLRAALAQDARMQLIYPGVPRRGEDQHAAITSEYLLEYIDLAAPCNSL